MCFTVLRMQVYLPEKVLGLFPNQNDSFHSLTGSGTVVYYPLKIHSVLLKNNLQECSSQLLLLCCRRPFRCQPGHNSPRDRGYPCSPPLLTATSTHSPSFPGAELSLFPATIASIGMDTSANAQALSEHHYKRKTLLMVTGTKEPSHLILSSDHPGILKIP